MTVEAPFKTKVSDCARCGSEHVIVVWEFTDPPEGHPATHFANCPVVSEPILVIVDDENGDDE